MAASLLIVGNACWSNLANGSGCSVSVQGLLPGPHSKFDSSNSPEDIW